MLPFNRVGALTYIDKAGLNERVYLNPDWLVKIVYEILDNDIVESNKGRITRADIEKIWKKKNKLYDKVEPLTKLLHHYNLMYHVSNTENYVVPAKLPSSCPYSDWEHAQEEAILQFRYTFDNNMPKGLMPRIIVSLHHHIKKHQNVWKTGFNIENEGTFAEIKKSANYNHFEIRVAGSNKRDLLSKIRERIDKILVEFKGLKYGEEIPCICQTCQTKGATPHFYKNSDLENTKKLGKIDFALCIKSSEMIKIECLLEGVSSNQNKKGGFMEMDRKEKKEINIFVSYKSEDSELRELLVGGLKDHLHRRIGFKYTLWDDTAIDFGSDWKETIEKALTKSKVAILLVSPKFASSKFIGEEELPRFFKEKKENGYLILPILMRKYDFSGFEELAKIQFFKTIHKEYGFKKPLVRNKLIPFDKLAEDENITDETLNIYYEKLGEYIHRAVSNHF